MQGQWEERGLSLYDMWMVNMKKIGNASHCQGCEATGALIHCRESTLPGFRQHSDCWLVQATIWANQGNHNICTWTIGHKILYVQSSLQDGPESRGHGTTKNPELALCSPGSKLSTLPTCLHGPHLTSESWQDFSQQKVDSALFKHTWCQLWAPW